uniref:V-set and immunoglobulin domain containing 4 n=2 Tax=Cyanistes caeruleus TaxID=156563 RepID=A0A8C0UPI4_CYACU
MGEVGKIAVFVMTFISCNALLDLSGVHQVTGTWMGSTTVPCTYVPSEGVTQQTLSWSVERDSSISTIFRRDDSGDHILLSKFRGRVSVPKHSPGDASLLIENLEMPDSGHYTCQIIWRSTDNSLITREVTTTVKVVKVAATKPIIRAGQLGLTLPAGGSTSLTCEASGSPPISYRWFRATPAGKAAFLSSGAELAWPSLRPSDSGTYFCEAENRAGAGAVQRSEAVQLTVTGEWPQAPLAGSSRLQCGGTASYFPARKEGNAPRTLTHPSPLAPLSALLYCLYSVSSSLRNCSSLMQKTISTSNIYLFLCGFFQALPGSVMLPTAVQQVPTRSRGFVLRTRNKSVVIQRQNKPSWPVLPSTAACLRDTHCTSHTAGSASSSLCRTVRDSLDSGPQGPFQSQPFPLGCPLENSQLSLPAYSISRAVKALLAQPSTGSTAWPVKEAEPAELPPRHEALAEALCCFSQRSHIGGSSTGTGSELQVLPVAAATASPSCQLPGGCFLLLLSRLWGILYHSSITNVVKPLCKPLPPSPSPCRSAHNNSGLVEECGDHGRTPPNHRSGWEQ